MNAFLKKVYKSAFHRAARLDLPGLAAWLLARVEERKTGSPEGSTARRRVLVLNAGKSGVLDDVEESICESGQFELIAWPSYVLDRIASARLSPGLTHNRYLTSDPAIERSKDAYRDFLLRMWRSYTARSPVDCVISANFGYYLQREFAGALEEAGTPFIVMHKENLNGITPSRADFWRTIYREGRGKFSGRKILVYNETERDLQITSGVADPERVVATGMPRLDRIHKWRRRNAGKPRGGPKGPSVLFFGFGLRDKIPVVLKKGKKKLESILIESSVLKDADTKWDALSWSALCHGTHKAVAELALERPDIRITAKTKGLASQSSSTEAMLGLGDARPSNLRLASGGDPFQMLTESDVVVGFNTTGLLEALAAGKPVIVPWFGEVDDEVLREIILDLGDTVDYARSPAELKALAIRHAENPRPVPAELSPEAAAVLRRWVGNDDGSAGRRVLDEVLRELPPRDGAMPVAAQ